MLQNILYYSQLVGKWKQKLRVVVGRQSIINLFSFYYQIPNNQLWAVSTVQYQLSFQMFRLDSLTIQFCRAEQINRTFVPNHHYHSNRHLVIHNNHEKRLDDVFFRLFDVCRRYFQREDSFWLRNWVIPTTRTTFVQLQCVQTQDTVKNLVNRFVFS